MHIRLYGMRTDVRGAPERSHRVLGVFRFVSAVRDRLRETPVRLTLRSDGAGPGRWGDFIVTRWIVIFGVCGFFSPFGTAPIMMGSALLCNERMVAQRMPWATLCM